MNLDTFATETLDKLRLLSNAEWKVFECLGKGLGRAELCAKLCIAGQTYDSHHKAISEKLGFEHTIGGPNMKLLFFIIRTSMLLELYGIVREVTHDRPLGKAGRTNKQTVTFRKNIEI